MNNLNNPTIKWGNIMVLSALRYKIQHSGQTNEKVDLMLLDAMQNDADRKLIDICNYYIQEISAKRRNSYGRPWYWEHRVAADDFAQRIQEQFPF